MHKTKKIKKYIFLNNKSLNPDELIAYHKVCAMHEVKDEDIKWLLVRMKTDNLIKNLIIDERLLAFLIMDRSEAYLVNISLYSKRLGWHKGEDDKIYDKYGLDIEALEKRFYDSLERVDMPEIIEQYETYLLQLQNIQENIKDGSETYFRCMEYFRKNHIKTFCAYNKKLEEKSVESTL